MSWIFQLFIVLAFPLWIESPITHIRNRKQIPAPPPFDPRDDKYLKREEEAGRRRGVDIGLQLKMPTTEKPQDIKALEKEIIETLEDEIKAGGTGSMMENLMGMTTDTPKALLLKPSFPCDRWDPKTRTCLLDRNVGDTVTFSLSTGERLRHGRPDIIWRKEFAQRDSPDYKEYHIDPQRSSRNLVIGRRGYEMRISPITDLDVDDNQFSASFSDKSSSTPYAKVNFKIRVMAEDLGFVYIGETLDLSIESHVTLPLQSMTYHWYTEKEGESSATLPSNMRLSPTGQTLRISELRQEQEGVVTCSVYTNKGVHATKRRFLVKGLSSNKDILKSFSNHNLTFDEQHQAPKTTETREKRTSPKHAKLVHHHKKHRKRTPKKRLKSERDIKEADVEGDQYMIVRSDQDLNAGVNSLAEVVPLDERSMSFENSSDAGAVININLDRERNLEEDKVAQMISFCERDLQCSKHASCTRTTYKLKGFCRCLPGFYGPGIFCREEM